VREFFRQRIYLQPGKAYWFFVSLLLTRAVMSSSAYKRLLEDLKKDKDILLYFYWGDNLCWIIPYLEKALGRKPKIVIRYHGSDLYEHLKNDYAPLRQAVLRAADRVFTVSENGKNYLTGKYPFVAEKTLIARLGVLDHGLGFYSGTKSEKVLITVANVVPVKRVHLVFETLQHSKLSITWHHFGDGSLMNGLKEKVKAAREGLTVVLHGHTTNRVIMEFFKNNQCDLFLNTSRSEGLPVAVMEALSFGVPVIATNVGGTSDLVSHRVGQLVDPDMNAEEMAAVIDSFLGLEESEIVKIRQNARSVYEEKVSAAINYPAFYKILEKV
jgi:glycosyltransferase involved in cell wall biosynthesis